MTDFSHDVLTIARRYVRVCGLSVIPVLTDGSKQPAVTWKRYQNAQPADSTLVRWFGGGVTFGIGITCGLGSGNLEVIDCDAPELWQEWVELVQSHAPGLYEILTISETPSGGRHVPYRCEDEVQGNQKLAMRAIEVPEGTPKAVRDGDRWIILKTLFETRGQGGQIVAPGSPLCTHQTGKPYRWIQGSPETIPTVTREQRDLLIGLARALNEFTPVQDKRREPQEYKQANRLPSEGARPGDDFNERGDVESVLLNHSWTVAKRRGSIVYLRKPGKRLGHQATLHAVAHNVFFVFSTSAYPFEPLRGYSAFQVYTILEQGGDFNAAAKTLASLGYGSRGVPYVIKLEQPKCPAVTVHPTPPSRPSNTIQLPKPMRPTNTVQLVDSGGAGR